jgi:anti-anti-sigma factor
VVTGELDLATAPILEREFEEAWNDSADLIVVDLSRVTFVDSSAIHLLIRMDCAALGEKRLGLIIGSPQVERVLTITGVRDHLPIIAPPSTNAIPATRREDQLKPSRRRRSIASTGSPRVAARASACSTLADATTR